MRKQVELLKHHADLGADDLDVLEIMGQFGPVDDDRALLVVFEPVDTADQGGFARA